ncbi:MAG: choice-of-anchor Q domain-containing protein, partial [Solirubrobacterales bacterium]
NYADYGEDLADGDGGDGAFYAEFSLIGYYDANVFPYNTLFAYDPQLLPLGDNGGPTETHLPGADSPALDAGISNALPTDQRGFDRTVDLPGVGNAPGSDATDIGAVEVQAEEEPEEEPVPPVTPPLGVGADVFEQCLGRTAKLTAGTSGDDDLVGQIGRDVIRAFAGDDRLRALEGRDCLFGDEGTDLLKGGGGRDLLSGADGTDRLKGQGGSDRLDGGADRDNINGDDGKDRIDGGAGDDKLGGNQGDDKIKGRGGDDRIRAGTGEDKVKAGSGSDKVGAVDALRDKVNCGGGSDRAVVDPIDDVSANCEQVVVVEADT